MSGIKEIKKSMAEALDIPPEIALNTVKLVVEGRGSLLAENHRGILEYSGGKIAFRVTEGSVEVLGKGLQLKSLSPEELAIEGEIMAICLVREDAL